MRVRQAVLITGVLVVASGLSGTAQNARTANDVLLAATSAYEDMVEFALDGDAGGVTRTLAVADREAAGVKTALPPEASARFSRQLRSLHESATAGKYEVVATTGVDVFRLFLDHLDPKALEVPREVSLLDYAGFRLTVLAAAARPDWNAMRGTVDEASRWWKATSSGVTDRALRDAFDSTVEGLQEASTSENLPMLRFAAQMTLDLVDLLEHQFEAEP